MADHEDKPASALDWLLRIRGVSWEWAEPDHPSYRPGRQMGVIAQEVQAVFPELVQEQADGYLAVDYAGLMAPVIEAMRELDARLRAIESAAGGSPGARQAESG